MPIVPCATRYGISEKLDINWANRTLKEKLKIVKEETGIRVPET